MPGRTGNRKLRLTRGVLSPLERRKRQEVYAIPRLRGTSSSGRNPNPNPYTHLNSHRTRLYVNSPRAEGSFSNKASAP